MFLRNTIFEQLYGPLLTLYYASVENLWVSNPQDVSRIF